MAELLKLENIVAGYGEARVLDHVSLTLEEGKALALLGRNGTGKTTLSTRSPASPGASRARSRSAAATSRGCGPISARMPGSAGCRRSATSSSR